MTWSESLFSRDDLNSSHVPVISFWIWANSRLDCCLCHAVSLFHWEKEVASSLDSLTLANPSSLGLSEVLYMPSNVFVTSSESSSPSWTSSRTLHGCGPIDKVTTCSSCLCKKWCFLLAWVTNDENLEPREKCWVHCDMWGKTWGRPVLVDQTVS